MQLDSEVIYDWNELQVGREYRFDEDYLFQAEGVLDEIEDGEKYISITFTITKPYYGAPAGVQYKWSKIKDTQYGHYIKTKVHAAGAPFTYLTPGYSLDDWLKDASEFDAGR